MTETMIKLFASIESETGLKAYTEWLQLQWYKSISTDVFIFIILIPIAVYAMFLMKHVNTEADDFKDMKRRQINMKDQFDKVCQWMEGHK